MATSEKKPGAKSSLDLTGNTVRFIMGALAPRVCYYELLGLGLGILQKRPLLLEMHCLQVWTESATPMTSKPPTVSCST